MMEQMPPFTFACPACKTALQSLSPDELRCPSDGIVYRRQGRIWRFLTPERQAYFEQFVREYETVCKAEGHGSNDAAYYQSLPFEDLTGRLSEDWTFRAASFAALVERVIRPLEKRNKQPLKILDLGAGNGWLSNRLSERGHQLAAVDLLTNTWDGLGAHIYYATSFTPVQAEFESLPFIDGQVDLAVFNTSFQFATDYVKTLKEAFRTLKATGQVVILGTPVYHQAASGEQMVSERQALFRQQYGFAFDALPSQNYLTDAEIRRLGSELGLYWKVIKPFYGLQWMVKPWLARLRKEPEPARFLILVFGLGSSASA
jgi:SAM-dependent methyltransferase